MPVLVFDLALLVFQMQDGPPLRVVQRRGPVARAQQESGEHRGGDQLQTQAPADRTETNETKGEKINRLKCYDTDSSRTSNSIILYYYHELQLYRVCVSAPYAYTIFSLLSYTKFNNVPLGEIR